MVPHDYTCRLRIRATTENNPKWLNIFCDCLWVERGVQAQNAEKQPFYPVKTKTSSRRTYTEDEVSAPNAAFIQKQRTRGWHTHDARLCNYWLLGVILMHSALARTQPALRATERWSAVVYHGWKLSKSCILARRDRERHSVEFERVIQTQRGRDT